MPDFGCLVESTGLSHGVNKNFACQFLFDFDQLVIGGEWNAYHITIHFDFIQRYELLLRRTCKWIQNNVSVLLVQAEVSLGDLINVGVLYTTSWCAEHGYQVIYLRQVHGADHLMKTLVRYVSQSTKLLVVHSAFYWILQSFGVVLHLPALRARVETWLGGGVLKTPIWWDYQRTSEESLDDFWRKMTNNSNIFPRNLCFCAWK